MSEIKKEVFLQREQPQSKNPINHIISQEVDLFDEELKQEAQTLALQETPSFPYTLFPAPLAQFIEDTSKALSCSPDFVGVGVLSCASVAIGNGAVLELKKSWITGASLYCAIVAEPGSAKTPAISKALKPLYDLQEYNFNEYQTKKVQYDLKKENFDIDYEKWKQSLKGKKEANLEDKPCEPKNPSVQQIISMDSTMEAMQEILLFNQRGVIKLHDELLGFFKGMNQYRSGADRQYWLSIWSNEPIIINRKGKEPIRIPNPFVSILGGIQPDMIEEIVKAEREGSANDGFIDRFLFCYPDPVSSNWTDQDVSEEVVKGYCDVMFKLFDSLNEDNVTQVCLSPEAKESFTMWYDVTEEETVVAGFPEVLKGVWRKLKGLHPRIMLIMHLLKWAFNSKTVEIHRIEKDVVTHTSYIMEYFKAHAKKVFQYTQSNYEDKNAIKLMDYVKRKGEQNDNGISIRVNALNQGKVFGRYTNIRLIEETIERIEAQGLGEIQHLKYKNTIVKQFFLRDNAIKR